MKGKSEQKNEKTHWAKRLKDAIKARKLEKQEERED